MLCNKISSDMVLFSLITSMLSLISSIWNLFFSFCCRCRLIFLFSLALSIILLYFELKALLLILPLLDRLYLLHLSSFPRTLSRIGCQNRSLFG